MPKVSCSFNGCTMAPFCFGGHSGWEETCLPKASINDYAHAKVILLQEGMWRHSFHVKRRRKEAISRLVLIFWKLGRHRHSLLLPSIIEWKRSMFVYTRCSSPCFETLCALHVLLIGKRTFWLDTFASNKCRPKQWGINRFVAMQKGKDYVVYPSS